MYKITMPELQIEIVDPALNTQPNNHSSDSDVLPNNTPVLIRSKGYTKNRP